MKKLLPILFLFCIGNLTAQVVDVITGLTQPLDIKIQGNTVFFTDFLDGSIYSFNHTDANPVAEELFSGLISPTTISLDGDLMYVAQNSSSSPSISVVDLTTSPLELTAILVNAIDPHSFFRSGDDLYIVSLGNNGIYKIDLTASDPMVEEVITGLMSPVHAHLDGNDLYIVEYTGRISKIDITDSNPVPVDVITDLEGPNHVTKIGDELIITEYIGNRISKLDLNAATPTPELLVEGLDGPTRVALVSGTEFIDMYITVYNEGKISKFTTDIVNTEEINVENQLVAFPNPARDFLFIKNIKGQQTCEIFNLQGQKISEMKVEANQSIDIRSVPTGQYILKIKDGQSLIFTKI